MKRTGAALSLILILVMLLCPMAYATGLTVEEVSPADGAKGKQPQNMALKVTFSENMMDEDAIAFNTSKFKVTNTSGAAQAFKVIYNADKKPNDLWIVLEETLESDTEYSFEIMPGIKSASGTTLDEGVTTTFRTRNTATDAKISMALMAVMMFVMFGATAKAAKKAAQANDPKAMEKMKEESLNPYKIAKLKGISLEEAQLYVDKEKAKIEKKRQQAEAERLRKEEARAQEMAAIAAELEEAERKAGNFRVEGPRSVKAAGGRIPRSVIKKNQERREAERRAEKERTKNKKKK